MPTTAWDLRFMRRMIGMMLAGCFLLLVGILLDPFTPDNKEN
jgi:hypothetical protein